MRHLISAALLAVLCVSAIAEQKVISLKLINTITLGATKSAEASFQSLDSQATEAFRRSVFVGKIAYENLSNGETRLTISWDTVKDGSKSASVEPFVTRVATSDAAIPAGTTLKARGDTALLTAAIRNMKEDGTKTASNGWANGTTGTQSATGSYTTPTATTSRQAYSSGSGTSGNIIYTPPTTGGSSDSGSGSGSGSGSDSGSGSGSGSGSDSGSGSGSGSGSNGSNGSDGSSGASGSNGSDGSSGGCKPIVDLEAGTYTVTEKDGDACKPTAIVSSIYETATGCPQITDFDNSIVKIATRKYAMPSAAETQVTPCAQTGKTATLAETFNGCQWKEDLDRNLAVLQKRYYFMFAGEPVYVTSCVNSDRTESLDKYKGDLGCKPIINEQAGTYQETASNNGLCEAVGALMKIYYDESQCEPFIDWTNSSVTLARIPYVNKATGKEFVGSCERSDTQLALQTTTDGCAPVLDKKNELAIEQVRHYYDQGGAAKYVTGCQNSDVTYKITTYREYNGVCKNLIDVANLNVMPNYRTMTRLNDKTLEVKGCQYDDQNVSLEATYEGCDQRHDFLVNKTFEQERLYYLWNGERNYATGCRDSKTVYNHYLTTATCQFQNVNNKVIVNKRIAYNQSDGTVGYATACKPVSDEIAIAQEFCDYEHDFIVNQSYRRERDYFVDPVSQERVYLNTCSRTNVNFPHREESNGWTNDDENLRSYLKVRKYFIDTTISATTKIYPNGTDYYDSLPVPYANKGTLTKVKTPAVVVNDLSLTFFNGVYKWNDIILDASIALPYSSNIIKRYESKSINYYHLEGNDWGTFDQPTAACKALDRGFGLDSINTEFYIGEDGKYDGTIRSVCYVTIGYAKIAQMISAIDYLRADGTTYSVEIDTWYQVQP